MKKLKVLLILVAVVCIGVAASYPIRYKLELDSNNSELEDLSTMRRRVMQQQHVGLEAEGGESPGADSEARDGETAPNPTDEGAPVQPVETRAAADAEPSQAPSAMPEPRPTEAPAQTDEVTATVTATSAVTLTDTVTATPTDAVTASVPTEPDAQATREAEPGRTAEPDADRASAAPSATPTPGIMDLIIDDVVLPTRTPPATSTPKPSPSPSPSPTPDRSLRDDADTFKDKAKVRLDVNRILPELREIYELNHDLVGWLYIEDTNIDYPVVQSEDGKFYLKHDFYGRSNANGQIILEDKCDPYTPSYNLVLSGHHMNSGAMFGRLGKYKDKSYWETHKIVEFDTLMARKRYVIFGAFYSADYDENEKGFRYSADIQYKLDADMWLEEIYQNQIYETGVEAEFGDEFITLTTCDHSRRYDGRFVVVARRIREGENIQ